MFNANWDLVEGKVPFELAVVEEAGNIGANLLHAIGVTEVGDVRNDADGDWPSLRARAFRLLTREYDELRRAVAFLRFHQGDAAAFTPSLHTTSRRRSSAAEPEPTTPDEVAPTGTLPAAPSKTAPEMPGMPGERPFES